MKRHSISLALGLAVGACFISAALCSQLASFVSVPHEPAAWSVLVLGARFGC